MVISIILVLLVTAVIAVVCRGFSFPGALSFLGALSCFQQPLAEFSLAVFIYFYGWTVRLVSALC